MRTGPPPRAQQVSTILLMLAMLGMILLTRNQCGRGTANLFNTLDSPPPPSMPAPPPAPRPDEPPAGR